MRLAAATVLALLALAAPATAKVETASLGSIRAELSYTPPKQDGTAAEDIVMRVFDGDTQIAERAIPDDRFMRPAYVYAGDPSVFVSDLDGDGIGEARFDLYTGGAHCCLLTYVYDGATEIEHDFSDPGYTLRDVGKDGVPEFVSADARFSYAFGSYAASRPPVQVWRLVDGELVDVTRDPAMKPLVRRDARRMRRYYREAVKETRKDPVYRELIRTTLLGYTADRCLLGRCDYGLARRTVRRGLLPKSYLKRLERQLAKTGYAR